MHQENAVFNFGQDQVSCKRTAWGVLHRVAEGAESVICGLRKNVASLSLAKDQVTREARTRTTKRYVTLDSLFFSYILEIEEAFHP
jgi:hypothetical protein